MPSLAVHLAIANKFKERFKINDEKSFDAGMKEPDIKGFYGGKDMKHKMHYSDPRNFDMTTEEWFASKVNLLNYLENNEIKDDFDRGYFLHLITDYFFFNCFLHKAELLKSFSFKMLYKDYDKISKRMEDEYGVDNSNTPWENMYDDGEPQCFSMTELYEFIDICASVNLDDIKALILNDKNNWRENLTNLYYALKQK